MSDMRHYITLVESATPVVELKAPDNATSEEKAALAQVQTGQMPAILQQGVSILDKLVLKVIAQKPELAPEIAKRAATVHPKFGQAVQQASSNSLHEVADIAVGLFQNVIVGMLVVTGTAGTPMNVVVMALTAVLFSVVMGFLLGEAFMIVHDILKAIGIEISLLRHIGGFCRVFGIAFSWVLGSSVGGMTGGAMALGGAISTLVGYAKFKRFCAYLHQGSWFKMLAGGGSPAGQPAFAESVQDRSWDILVFMRAA